MPPFLNQFPFESVMGGQQVAKGLQQAEADGYAFGKQQREEDAMRAASAQLGANPYISGYENVKGAERPDYLKQLYAQGNYEQAAKLEDRLAEPFKLQRQVQMAGEMESAKKAADAEQYMKMYEHFRGGGAGSPGGTAGSSDSQGLQQTFKMTPQGPVIEMQNMAPIELASKQAEIEAKRSGTTLAYTKEDREAQNQAHEQMRQVNQAIVETQRAVQNRDMTPDEGHQRILELSQMREQARMELDTRLRGGAAPQSVPPPAAPVNVPRGTISSPPVADGLTYKERGAMESEQRKAQMVAANKEIETARADAKNILQYKPKIMELLDLVTKNEIGHPGIEGIPFAENMLTATSRTNSQVKNVADQLVAMFMKTGQSGAMNTIAEVLIHTAGVPKLTTDPQQNKINIAQLASGVEHTLNFAPFLEKWQKKNGTTDGSTEAWIDYAQHNPLYSHKTDARGRVSVEKMTPMAPDTWMRLRSIVPGDELESMQAAGGIRFKGDKIFIKQPDGAWRER